MLVCLPTGSAGKEIPEIQKQIEATKKSLQGVKEDIEQKKEILRSFEKREKGILGQLQAMDKKLALKEEQLESYDQTLKKVQSEKEQLENETGDLKADLDKIRGYLSKKVVQLYKHGGYSYLKALFSAGSYPEILKRYRFLQIMANKDRENLDGYHRVYSALYTKQQGLAEREDKILSLQKSFKGKNQEIVEKRKERSQLLTRIREEKAVQQELLKEFELSSQSLEATIQGLIQQQESLFGSFEKTKGNLRWPVHGKVVTRFGKHKHEKFNTYVFSKGIDIEAGQGSEVKAVYNGTVLFADWFKGYGQMLILDHGKGFYSLYAHLDRILVSLKKTIQQGEPVGKVGETGSLKGPLLYFEIRYHGEPQDPLTWLARR